VPLIVKDNFDTADMPTTAGWLSLKGSIPASDAFQVRKLQEAGALVLAKSNIAEFAWSRFETVGTNRKYLAIIEGMDFSVHRRLILG
jgi:Asp-tRNA(Asn)/Glu-tRNA(Gln) amidotransferase A subunit family amidase